MKRIAVALSLTVFAAGLSLLLLTRKPPSVPAPAPDRPRILEAKPEGLVREPQPITVLFDRAMVPDSEVGTEAKGLAISPAVRGHAVGLTPYAIELRPEALEPGTAYTARVADHEWSFRTPGLTILRAEVDSPAPDAPLKLRFSHSVDAADLRPHVSLGTDFTIRKVDDLFELRPAARLPLGSKWTWTIRRGLRSGKLELDEDRTVPFEVCSPLRITSIRPRSSPTYGCAIDVAFNHPIAEKSGRVRVGPRFVRPSRSWDELEIHGGLKPGQSYDVMIAAVRDRYGLRMGPVSFAVRMPDYEPEVHLRSDSGVLERREDARFPVRFVNIRDAVVQTLAVQPGRELEAWRAPMTMDALLTFGFMKSEPRRVSDEPNQVTTLGLPLEKSGVVIVQVIAENRSKIARLQVTDLALHAKQSSSETLVWTTSLTKGQPVECDVTLHDGKGRELWRGRSGPDGCLLAPPIPELQYVVARHDGDVAILDTDGDGVALWRHNVATGRAPALRIHAFTDRGIYRPGDLVRLKATLRPIPSSAEIVIRDSRDRVVLQQRVTPTEFGTLGLDYRHRERDPLGSYSVQVADQCVARFRVECYRPAPFEVTVRHDGLIDAHTYFGTPVQGRLFARRTLEQIEFSPPGWDDYTFGDATEWPSGVEHLEGIETAIDGSTAVPIPTATKLRGTVRLTLEATVQDASHRCVDGETSWTLHPAAIYLGIKTESYVVASQKAVPIQVIAVTPEGKPRTVAATISVLRREWHTVAKKSAGGSITYESQPVDRTVVEASLETPRGWSFIPPRAGYYLVRAEAEGAVTVADLYASGPEASGWHQRGDLKLRMVADRKSYRPGETAQILVPSPFEGATALVTVERERVLESRIQKLGTSSVIEIPIATGYAPNVFVSVVLIQGRTSEDFSKDGVDLGRPTYRVGYLTLPVVDEQRRIDVAVVPERPVYAPRDEVTLELRTSQIAELTVLAVDESVLALTGYTTPDPYTFFSQPRPLSVRSAESRKSVLARTAYDEFGRKGDPGGGGGGKEEAPRAKFAPTAAYQILRCDGAARVTFRLQENVTRYRIMVFAVGLGDAYGKAQSEIVVRKPLILTSAMPRFVRVGDRFEARVLVTSEVGGEARVEMNGAAKTVFAPRGRTVAVGFPATAQKRFTFLATLGPDRDGLEIDLPVLPAAPTETRVLCGKDRGRFVIPTPPLEEMEVTLSRSPLAELEGGLHYLLEYPHGCIEQTTSRTLPLLAVRWGADAPTRALLNGDVRPFAQAGLDRILSMQLDGGFSYWPGGREAHAWGTVYATHALVLGSRQGYEISAVDLQRALDAVSRLLRTEAPIAVRAYATYVLALAGRPEPGYVAALSLRPDVTPTARAFLGVPGPVSGRDCDVIYSGLEDSVELLMHPDRFDLAQRLLQTRTNGRWSKTVENAFAILALARAMGEESGTVRVRTKFGESTLGPALRFTAPAQRFEVDSDGTVYWTVVARGPSPETRRIDRGIGLVREMPSEVRAGETIEVKLRVIVRNTAEYVAIEDPLAAGFEPLLEDAGSHAERRDDRVLIYADRLSPGIHDFSYHLRAIAPGVFTLPSTRVEEMYRTEIYGTTARSTVTIR